MKRVIAIGGTVLMIMGCALAPLRLEPAKVQAPLEVIPTEIPQGEIFVLKLSEAEPVKPQYQSKEYTQAEAQMLMRIAQAEAGNQGVYGMVLVMTVVINRVNSPDFPNSIEEVIFQPYQFQSVSDGNYSRAEISTEAHMALASIESGEPIDESIIAFEVKNNDSLERYFKYAYTVGEHNFYISKGEK